MNNFLRKSFTHVGKILKVKLLGLKRICIGNWNNQIVLHRSLVISMSISTEWQCLFPNSLTDKWMTTHFYFSNMLRRNVLSVIEWGWESICFDIVCFAFFMNYLYHSLAPFLLSYWSPWQFQGIPCISEK
jgi:hypothetical protein